MFGQLKTSKKYNSDPSPHCWYVQSYNTIAFDLLKMFVLHNISHFSGVIEDLVRDYLTVQVS